jgi:50S ribosomal protein L16 3-hydroxylase
VSDYLNPLFEQLSAATFVDRYFHQLPIAVPGGAKHIASLGTFNMLDAIAAHVDAKVERSRRGDWWPNDARPTPDEVRQSLSEGWTIFVRHSERYYARLAELADEFRSMFQAPIDIHFFCTPAATEGFGWHYDVEDVFILQALGTKTYRLRKNTVNPWPLVETTPSDLSYEAERSLGMECTLNAGGWLYIPPGYWHATRADDLSISLSVGVMSPAAVDLLELLRPILVQSLRWRQRLPLACELTGFPNSQDCSQFRAILADLAKDLAAQLVSDGFVDHYQRWRTNGSPSQSDSAKG